MNHFQLRFTPAPVGAGVCEPIQEYDMSGVLLLCKKYVLSYETKDKHGDPAVPHFHLYGETDASESKVRTHVRTKLRIPEGGKGKSSAYTCVEYNKYANNNPGYVCKWGDIKESKGYSAEEVSEYIEKGKKQFIRPKAREIITIVPGAEGAGKRTQLSLIEQFQEYMDEVLPKDRTTNEANSFTLDGLARKNYAYWKSRNGGLFPPRETERRFMKSAWAQWCDIIRKAECLAIADLEEKKLL